MSYENVKLTDVLDTAYITFINDSVEVNNVVAQSSEYNYDDSTHNLTINLASVNAQAETIISFSVKKLNDFFILINSVLGTLSDGNSVQSYTVKTLSPINRWFIVNNYGCGVPLSSPVITKVGVLSSTKMLSLKSLKTILSSKVKLLSLLKLSFDGVKYLKIIIF